MWVLKWLKLSKKDKASARPEDEALSKILDAIDMMNADNPDQARYLACFAYILGRVAYSDGEISQIEVQRMKELLRHHAKMTMAEAGIVVDIAKMENVMGDRSQTSEISALFARLASPAQQAALIDALFAVAAADQVIYPVEASEIVTIGEEIGLPNRQVLAIRGRYLQFIQAQEYQSD